MIDDVVKCWTADAYVTFRTDETHERTHQSDGDDEKDKHFRFSPPHVLLSTFVFNQNTTERSTPRIISVADVIAAVPSPLERSSLNNFLVWESPVGTAAAAVATHAVMNVSIQCTRDVGR